MKVSFVIPLFNCLDLTKACLASLRATLPQSLDHEIILIDDGSTDGTREWLGTLSGPFRIILNESNLGYAGSNNRGAREATGDILALLNNDLVLLPGWLPPMLRLFRFDRRPGMVGNVQLDAATRAVDHTGIFINRRGKPEHRGFREGMEGIRSHRAVFAITGACAFVRRDTFLALGGFDERFRNGGEDVDFCIRARAAGLRNWVALKSRVLHHVSSSPGRKAHDEENSRRLAAKWRDVLVREGAQTWCREFLQENWNEPRSEEPVLTIRAMLSVWGLSRRPPPEVRMTLDDAMTVEERRWDALLGPAKD